MDKTMKRISHNDPWKSASRSITEISKRMIDPRTIWTRADEAKLFGRVSAKNPLISRKNILNPWCP